MDIFRRKRAIPILGDEAPAATAARIVSVDGVDFAIGLRWISCTAAGAQKLQDLRKQAKAENGAGWLFRGPEVLGNDCYAVGRSSDDKRLLSASSAAQALAACQQRMQRKDVLALLQIPSEPGAFWACCTETDDSDGHGATLPAYSTDTVVDEAGAVALAESLRNVNDELSILVDDAAYAVLKHSNPSIEVAELSWATLAQNATDTGPLVKHKGGQLPAMGIAGIGVAAAVAIVVLLWPEADKGPTPAELAAAQAAAVVQREERELSAFMEQTLLATDPFHAAGIIDYALDMPSMIEGYRLQSFTCNGITPCESEWLATRWAKPEAFRAYWRANGGTTSLPVDGNRGFVAHTDQVLEAARQDIDLQTTIDSLQPQDAFIMSIVELRAQLNSAYPTGWSLTVQPPAMHPTLGRSGHPAAMLQSGVGHGIARASFERQWIMNEILPALLGTGMRANRLRISSGQMGARIELEAAYAIQEL